MPNFKQTIMKANTPAWPQTGRAGAGGATFQKCPLEQDLWARPRLLRADWAARRGFTAPLNVRLFGGDGTSDTC